MPDKKNNTAERELRFSKVLDATIKEVWEAWTNPEDIQHWWGPDGFTNTIIKMDIKNGGVWDLIMHGPDGTDYEIKSVFREIDQYKKIVYEQLTHFRYVATIEFESRKDKTFINWHMLFESKEHLIEAARTYKVDAGFRQNAERLVSYLLRFKVR
jgi:uncharacterized protein YndB with AHSA1/START domain